MLETHYFASLIANFKAIKEENNDLNKSTTKVIAHEVKNEITKYLRIFNVLTLGSWFLAQTTIL